MNLLNNRLLKTELVEWKKLIPFQPDNLKKTEPHKLQKLANSLCENGFSMNFYVWEKDGQIYIIDGHSRHEVLQLLESGAIYPKSFSDKTNYPYGLEYSVTIPDKLPCSFLHLKNKTEAKKAVLIYNSKYKSIDSDILSEWVSDLSLDELKSQIEIPELKLDFDTPKELESDSIDDTTKITTNIKLGDLIEIGNHRLLCGDSTNKEDVERLMDGKKADMVFTDPPYGVSASGGRSQTVEKNNIKPIANDNLRDDELVRFLTNAIALIPLKDSRCFYICYDQKTQAEFITAIKDTGWSFKRTLVWNKNVFGLSGRKGYRPKYELIAFGSVGENYEWFGDNAQADVLDIDRPQEREGNHPTPKPIKLIEIVLKNSSQHNEIVVDLFLGSGSTMVACQTLDRICYGMELEPIYCQVIINRMRKNFPELEIKVNGQIYAE